MQCVRVTHLTAVIGLALASGLYAQRGGGHSGPGASASNASVGRSGLVGPALTPGSSARSTHFATTSGPGIGGQPYPVRTDIPTPLGLNSPASAYTGILPGAYKSPINSYGRGNRFYPGFAAAPLFLPTYWDNGFSSFSGYDNAAPPIDPNAQALADSQEALAQQIQQLSTEVQQMKSGSRQPTEPSTSAPAVSAAPENRPPAPPVTLVLRDGQQISVENYAVMNQMFWNFSKRPAQKIPISDIDIAASTKATEANGGEFPQLGSPQ